MFCAMCVVCEMKMNGGRRLNSVPAHSPTFPSLHLRHNSFSNPSVTSPTSQLILQRFRPLPTSQFILQTFFRFSYVTNSSLNSPGEPPMVHGNSQDLHSGGPGFYLWYRSIYDFSGICHNHRGECRIGISFPTSPNVTDRCLKCLCCVKEATRSLS